MNHVLASRVDSKGFQYQIIRSESMEVPGGSVLVIPLLPIPIAKKEKVVRTYLEILNPEKQSIEKLNNYRLIEYPLTSVADLSVSNGIRAIYPVISKTSPRMTAAVIEISGEETPYDIQELIAFIKQNSKLVEEIFKAPVGVIVEYANKDYAVYAKRAPGQEGAVPHFTLRGLYLSVFFDA